MYTSPHERRWGKNGQAGQQTAAKMDFKVSWKKKIHKVGDLYQGS